MIFMPIFTIFMFFVAFLGREIDLIILLCLSCFSDSLLVFAVLFFIPGMPVAIWRIGFISLVLTCGFVYPLCSVLLRQFTIEDIKIHGNDPCHIVLYSCQRRQGNEKYFKVKEDLPIDEMRINAQEIKPSMGVFLPVKDERERKII